MDTGVGEEGESGIDASEGDSDDDSEGGSDDDSEDSSDESGCLAGHHERRYDGRTQLGKHLAKPISQEMRDHLKWSRREIKDRKAMSDGTWAKAGGEEGNEAPTHAISAIALEDLVVAGLTDDKKHLEIVKDKVYFNVEAEGFKKAYNMVSKVNPGDIGITMGETKVDMDDARFTVVSVEDGLYSLAEEGSGSRVIELGQWELLDNRVDDGVGHTTLEADQRKFAISLITQYGNLWLSMIPFLKHGQASIPEKEGVVQVVNMTYMMNEIPGKDEDHTDIMTARSLTKAALHDLKMVDAIDGLRFPGLAQEGDDDLRAFAEKEGSLGELNGLQQLLGVNSGLDKRMMLNVKQSYPKDRKPTGDFRAAINHMLRVQQYAYRMGRPVSLHEGYHPLCPTEVTALSQFFRGWEEVDEGDIASCLATSSTSENMSWATRFAVRRSSMVCPDLFPASVEIESRDTQKYGSCVDSSKHVCVFTKTRKAKHVIRWILQNGGVCDNMNKKVQTAEAIFELTKSTTTEARGKKKDYNDTTTGKQGDSNTLKKGKLPLLVLAPEMSEKCLRLMTEALTKNGWGFLRKQIELIDSRAWGKNGWCWEIVASGFRAATDKSGAATGHDHFGGRNKKEKEQIAKMVNKLKVAGVKLRDFEAAWGATLVLSAFNGACLRDQFHRFLKKRTSHIRSKDNVTGRRGLGDGRNVDRVTMWTPEKSKTGKCKERVFDPLCSEWLTVLLVIGWAFYDKEGVVLEDEMGIPNSSGKMKLKGSWDKVIRKVGSTFLGVEKLTLHNLRTVFSSLAVKYFYGKGYNLNDAPFLQLAESMDTGVKVC